MLDAVLDQGPGKRSDTSSAGAPDRELQAAVSALLARQKLIANFLESPAVLDFRELIDDLRPDALLCGRRVGPYRLVRELGRGGMGVVWLGERVDGKGPDVALKMIHPWALHGDLLQRFRTERHILTALRHPNIARLLDADSTAEGETCLVLEYVDGRPIDQFCSAEQLDLHERLALFLIVARATEYAHEQGIVHRDLKPANILVTRRGDIKLVDFGIGKLLSADASQHTHSGRRWLTVAHAAPEQIRGEPITIQTDVYHLGVLLYQLLAGRRPFQHGAVWSVERDILSTKPVPPSRAVLRNHESDFDDLARAVEYARLLRGELDAIILKAMSKRPQERYSSVGALADDITRYIVGRPTSARSATLSFRAGAFTHQHQWAVLAAGALVGVLLARAPRVALHLSDAVRALLSAATR